MKYKEAEIPVEEVGLAIKIEGVEELEKCDKPEEKKKSNLHENLHKILCLRIQMIEDALIDIKNIFGHLENLKDEDDD